MNGVAARLIDAPGNAIQHARFASKQMNARGAPIGRQRVARSNDVWPPHRVIARHILALKGVVGLFLRRIGDAISEHGGEGVGLSRILEPSGGDFGWCVEEIACGRRDHIGGRRRGLTAAHKERRSGRRRRC